MNDSDNVVQLINKNFRKTEKQVEAVRLLASDHQHIMLYGGSRSGKTFILLRSLVIRALRIPSRHLITRFRFNHAKQSIWYDTFPKMMKMCFPTVKYEDNKSDWFWRFTNGSEIWLGGLDDKERTDKILGNEYATIYFNECSQISYDSITTALTRLAQNTALTNKAYYDQNPPSKRHWSYAVFVEGVDPVGRTAHKMPELYGYMQINPTDNRQNLPPTYIENILENLPLRKRKRFLDGEFSDDNERALWKRWMIDDFRVKDAPYLSRIVVAIDPAVTSSETSDDTGIVVVGEGRAPAGAKNEHLKHYYVLNDLTMKGTPLEWARVVSEEFKQRRADRVIGEVNNGGDLIEANIRNVDASLPYKGIHATRGKMVRAEPISALYEQGRVHHVGAFWELEDEMCDHEFTNAEASPNRLDALVWALTELAGMQGPIPAPRIDQRTPKTASKVRDLPL